MTDAAIFYRSHIEAIRALPEEERLRAYEAIAEYCLNDTEITEGISAAVLIMAKPILDKWKAKRSAGQKGGGSGSFADDESDSEANESNCEANESNCEANESNCEANESNCEAKEKVKVKGKVKEKEKDKRQGANFVPPTVEEVRAYCREKGYTFDPETFVAFYESKGWLVGRAKMKDWKSACVTWNKRRAWPGKPPDSKKLKMDQHNYDHAAIERQLLMMQHTGG